MCEIGSRFTVDFADERGYMKGRCGHKGWYLPPSASDKMRRLARSIEGKVVNIETVRGMFTKLVGIVQEG